MGVDNLSVSQYSWFSIEITSSNSNNKFPIIHQRRKILEEFQIAVCVFYPIQFLFEKVKNICLYTYTYLVA